MNIIWLKDLEEDCIDAVIISKTSTAEEIQTCIDKMKEEHEYDWQWDDLVDCLPEDCEMYDRWQNDENIYY